ncbi:MAG: Zn-dependent hydrolase [Myxococcales bacterium]|nr:Zn-dependent hydrolase [Myxococcales bacterium]
MTLPIDEARLWASLHELAAIGQYRDEDTGLLGVNRLALTDADAAGRRQVMRWFEQVGLAVRVDRIGNVYGRRSGLDDSLAPVLTGSHIDSVPTAGAFDGCLGVLGGLEVCRALDAAKVVTRRPIEVCFFTDEEGCRFGTDMLGSAVACGRLPLELAWSLVDRDGIAVKNELARIGFLGEVNERIGPPHAYVELHIEQGPVLAAEGFELGVVTGVQAISWQELTIVGKSAHAGTTPMHLRRDAGFAAARIHVQLHEMIASGRYGAEMRATMGRLELAPNRVNVVPGRVLCTVDLRNPDDARMADAERDVAAYWRSLAEELRVSIEARHTARTASVTFSAEVQAVIAGHLRDAGVRHRHILSGAGHDAQEFAAICPTAMIFVPGEHDGISHNPREYSTAAACARGARALGSTILTLAS